MSNKATQMIRTSQVEPDPLIPVPKDALRLHLQTLSVSAVGRRQGNKAPDAAACCVLTERVGDLVLLNEISSNPSFFSRW